MTALTAGSVSDNVCKGRARRARRTKACARSYRDRSARRSRVEPISSESGPQFSILSVGDWLPLCETAYAPLDPDAGLVPVLEGMLKCMRRDIRDVEYYVATGWITVIG
jgi:hypothetical protein